MSNAILSDIFEQAAATTRLYRDGMIAGERAAARREHALALLLAECIAEFEFTAQHMPGPAMDLVRPGFLELAARCRAAIGVPPPPPADARAIETGEPPSLNQA